MTTLSYIQHHTYGFRRHERHARILNVFRVFHGSKLVARFALFWIAAAALVYLVAMYSVFGLGIALQQQSTVAKDLTESNIIAELNLQQRQTAFARNNKDVLQSMQKISDMRYVLPADTTVSRVETSDRSSQ